MQRFSYEKNFASQNTLHLSLSSADVHSNFIFYYEDNNYCRQRNMGIINEKVSGLPTNNSNKREQIHSIWKCIEISFYWSFLP